MFLRHCGLSLLTISALDNPATSDSTKAVAKADGSANITTTGRCSNGSIEESVIVFNMLGQLTQDFNLVYSAIKGSPREKSLFSSASTQTEDLKHGGYGNFYKRLSNSWLTNMSASLFLSLGVHLYEILAVIVDSISFPSTYSSFNF